ncbi:MAG TPA: hypothetical protein VEQ63_12575, partial [Bryobacteraceae bacterium]|nr:hypothetical protein [Bryobacteraceae bacterium]
LTATAYIGKEAVAEALGVETDVPIIVVKVSLRPKEDNELKVWHEEFVLLSRRDGQRCQPMSPAQIAGEGALVVSSKGMSSGGIGLGNAQRRGPIWGGTPGMGDRPRRIGGDDDVAAGGAAPAETKTTAAQKAKGDGELVDILKVKMLPEASIKDTTEGYLYFILDGKHKLKDLELLYKTGSQKVVLDFLK